MKLDYVPLLRIQREIQGRPRGLDRFRHYLRTIWCCYESDFELIPLIFANPMARDHVTALLDELLALNADQIAAEAVAEADGLLAAVPGEVKAAVVVVDDLMGGWTNRYDYEFKIRLGPDGVPRGNHPAKPLPPRWSRFLWTIGILWSSERPTPQAVREAILMPAYRMAYLHAHGPARNLRQMLMQEGHVMAMAGCPGPQLDDDDIVYTRAVLEPYLDSTDKRTCMECLFGDPAGQTLGFTPRGLSQWAGLALALHDARAGGRMFAQRTSTAGT